MATIERSVTVDVPVTTAYNQWTQFEEFPRFMEGVREVTQLDDKRLRWRAEVGGREKEWEAEITEQIPDDRIAWRSRDGARKIMQHVLEMYHTLLSPAPAGGSPQDVTVLGG